ECAAHILNDKRETILGPVAIGARLSLLSIRSANEDYRPWSGAFRQVNDGGKLHAIAHRHHLFARLASLNGCLDGYSRNRVEQSRDNRNEQQSLHNQTWRRDLPNGR